MQSAISCTGKRLTPRPLFFAVAIAVVYSTTVLPAYAVQTSGESFQANEQALKELDSDKDGKFTKDELQLPEDAWKQLDADGDNTVTEKEIDEWTLNLRTHKFHAMDTNNDQQIDKREWKKGTPAGKWKSLDQDGDNVVSQEEFLKHEDINI